MRLTLGQTLFALTFLAFLLSGGARGAEPSLHLLCWSEYIPQSIVAEFTRSTGAAVEIENYNSNEQMAAKLRARPGWYDLAQPSGYYVRALAESDGWEPIDPDRIPNLRNLDPEFRHLAFDPEDRFSVPWLSGTVGIVVNTERVHDTIATCSDVFSGKFTHRIVVIDDPREMAAWALASLGLSIDDVSDPSLKKAGAVLEKWLPQVAVFDSDKPSAAMLDGRADIGIIWSGEAALLWQKDRKLHYVLPALGAHRFIDSLAIPKGAPHKAQAESFIDFCLRPEISAQISAAYPYTNPNVAARRLLSPEQLANPASYPPAARNLPTLQNIGNTTAAVNAFVRSLQHVQLK